MQFYSGLNGKAAMYLSSGEIVVLVSPIETVPIETVAITIPAVQTVSASIVTTTPASLVAGRWWWRLGDDNFQSQLDNVAARASTTPASAGYIARLIDNPNVSNELLRELMGAGRSGWDAYQKAHLEPDQAALFPDRDHYQPHIDAIQALMAITGIDDYQFLSDGNPGLGYTGAEGIAAWQTGNSFLNAGTIFHDFTSALMAQFDFGHGGSEPYGNLNTTFFGTPSIVLSALSMATQAYLQSIENYLIPPSEDILSFLGGGVTKEQLLKALMPSVPGQDPVAFYRTTSKLGNAAGQLASELALYYGDKGVASQVVTDAFAKTLGGYIGDAFTYNVIGSDLSAKAIYGRFYANFLGAAAGVGSGALASALERALDIHSPLGQFVAGSVTTALTNVFLDNVTDLALTYDLGVSADFAKAFIGTPAGTNLGLSVTAVTGEIMRNITDGFGSFLTGQLFNYLDQKWTSFNLNNLGSGIGGIIGNFIAPGIGGFVGQVAGGIVFDILDGTPRSFHNVYYNPTTKDFVTQFAFSDDHGQVALSKQLAETAMSALQLAKSVIGGDFHSIQQFTYGHYEDQLTYDGNGSGRVKFTDATKMLAQGVLAQLRTADISGGNLYAKDLVTRSNYSPTLDQFFSDFGVANVYDMQKADPYLFGMQMVNVADAGARRFVLTNWQGTLDAAHALGFQNLSFNDGGEFIARVGGNTTLSGERGNDFLYAESGSGDISGGDGDDVVKFDTGLLYGARDSLSGGTGTDRYEGDFSILIKAAGSDNSGINFARVNATWYILKSPDGVTTADFYDFEHFSIVGTKYDDIADITEQVTKFDGGDGIDSINVLLSAATSNITLDINIAAAQMNLGDIQVSNVERVTDIATGSGNDTIRIGVPLLDGYRNTIDSHGGVDSYEGDFADLSKPAGTDSTGIRFFQNSANWYILYGTNGLSTADFYNFEHFAIVGTQYDDTADITDKVDRFDGGAGTDTIKLLLGNATTSVVLDLGSSSGQLIFGSADLRNVERISDITTGAGNDTVRIGTALLDSYRNTLDAKAGTDTFEGNFSSLAATGTTGIRLFENSPGWYILYGVDGLATADFYGFEHFAIVGTRYDDVADITDKVDRFDGGVGIDTVRLSLASATSNVVFDLGATGSQLTIGSADLRNVERVSDVATGLGNDTVRIGTALLDSYRNTIDGNAGTDTFDGNFSSFDNIGTAPTGIRFFQNSPDWYIVYGANGLATADLYDFERFSIVGTRYDDTLDFTDKVMKFDGGDGIDAINVKLASATSAIVLDLSATGSQIVYGADDLRNVERVIDVATGSGNDVIRIGAALLDSYRNTIDAHDGNDTFEGNFSSYAGSETVTTGINAFQNSATWFIIRGQNGLATADLMNFEQIAVTGTRYNDSLTGTDQPDMFSGFDGNDILDGRGGADLLYGGKGDDTFYTDRQTDIVFEFAGEGIDTVISTSNFYLYAEIENLTLASGAGNIFAVGNELANSIIGNSGNNTLLAGAGADLVRGGAGIDIVYGEDGNDQLFGDADNDFLAGGSGDDVIDGGTGGDSLYGEGGNDILWGGTDFVFDQLVGGNGNDILHGDSGLADYDYLYGNAGDDSFYVDTGDDLTFEQAGEGTDTVYARVAGANNGVYLYANIENLVLLGETRFGVGNELANVITGNDVTNLLLGGAGNDTLNGEGGNDVLFGQSGTDTFVFEHGTGGDVIGDFVPGTDRIDLSAIGYTSFAQVQNAFHENGGSTAIDLGGGDLIVLNGVTAAQLHASDFIFATSPAAIALLPGTVEPVEFEGFAPSGACVHGINEWVTMTVF